MPKKGGKKQQDQTVAAESAQEAEETSKVAADQAEDTKVEDSTAGAISAAGEEQKVTDVPVATEAAKAPGLGRRNSRVNLQRDEASGDGQVLYRPEFGGTSAADGTQNKMWELMSSYQGSDKRSIQRSIVNHVEYTLARTRFNFDNKGAYQAASYSVRDRLIEAWNDTQQYHTVSGMAARRAAHTPPALANRVYLVGDRRRT